MEIQERVFTEDWLMWFLAALKSHDRLPADWSPWDPGSVAQSSPKVSESGSPKM